MNLNPVIISIPLFLLLIIIELVYESLTNKKTYRLNDAITNMNLGALQQVTGVFAKVVSVGVYVVVYEYCAIVQLEQNWWTFAALFILFDMCYYWSHRMAHEVSLFWGGHVVHHQSEDYNLTVALRQSSTAFIWSLPFYLPLAIMGFDPMQFVVINGLNLIYQFWIHTEHIDRLPRWFEWAMNTPSHHRVHHGQNPKYIDKNFAGVFIVWDRMFGTFQAEEERPTYGVLTPLNSWNPVYANVVHYINLFNMVKKARTFGDGFKMLFKQPGWQPDYLGGQRAFPEVPDNYTKYNSDVRGTQMKWYIAAQFVLAMLVIAYFLFFQNGFDAGFRLFSTLWIVLTSIMFAIYFEVRKQWVAVLEIVRLLAVPIGILFLEGIVPVLKNSLLIVSFMFVFFSVISFVKLQKNEG